MKIQMYAPHIPYDHLPIHRQTTQFPLQYQAFAQQQEWINRFFAAAATRQELCPPSLGPVPAMVHPATTVNGSALTRGRWPPTAAHLPIAPRLGAPAAAG